jgi:branched-chain amino acid transport system substrate-binding protein
MLKRPLAGLATLGLAASLLAACSDPDAPEPSSPSEPIRIAVIYGLSGAYAGTGGIFMTGFNAAVEHLNANGGVNGRQIDVKVIDDQSDGTKAVTELTQLLDSDYNPDIVVPGGVSSEVLAMLPLTSDSKIWTAAPGSNPSINDPGKYPYHFGTFAAQTYNLVPVGERFEEGNVERLAVILPADAFGDSLLAGLKDVADKAGVEIVQTERPDPNALNFDVEWQRVLGANPDAVFFDFASHDALARVLTSRLTVGATDIPAFGGTSAAAAVLANLVDQAALANCEMPVYTFTIKPETVPAHLAPLYEAFKGKDVSILSGGLGWDIVQLAKLAIERADGDTSAEALTEAVIREPVPANVMALFPGGTSYTRDNRFPTPGPGTYSLVACGATVQDGVWVE